MTIGTLNSSDPATSTNAGLGAQELQDLKAAIQASFPNFASAGGDDITQKTGPEIDAGVDLANSAIQTFAGNSPVAGAYTPQTDDYNIEQINDNGFGGSEVVAPSSRNFLSDADKAIIDSLPAAANIVVVTDNASALADMAYSGMSVGDLLMWDGSDFVEFTPPKEIHFWAFGVASISGAGDVEYSNLKGTGDIDSAGLISVANNSGGMTVTASQDIVVNVAADLNLYRSSGSNNPQFGIRLKEDTDVSPINYTSRVWTKLNDDLNTGSRGVGLTVATNVVMQSGDTLELNVDSNESDLNQSWMEWSSFFRMTVRPYQPWSP